MRDEPVIKTRYSEVGSLEEEDAYKWLPNTQCPRFYEQPEDAISLHMAERSYRFIDASLLP